jgi:hypothetical protein
MFIALYTMPFHCRLCKAQTQLNNKIFVTPVQNMPLYAVGRLGREYLIRQYRNDARSHRIPRAALWSFVGKDFDFSYCESRPYQYLRNKDAIIRVRPLAEIFAGRSLRNHEPRVEARQACFLDRSRWTGMPYGPPRSITLIKLSLCDWEDCRHESVSFDRTETNP